MSRSLGDHAVSDIGVSAEAEMTQSEIVDSDRCLILASDGVWEFITSQEAVDIVYKHRKDATAACKALIKESARRWKETEGNYRDDITAIVVFLPLFSRIAKGGKGTAMFDVHGEKKDREEVSFKANEERVEPRPSAIMREQAALEKSSPAAFIRRRLSVDDSHNLSAAAARASESVLERGDDDDA